MDVKIGIWEIYKKVATSIPPDVENALKNAYKKEEGAAKEALEKILKNITLARQLSKPICQDTGVPIFFIKTPVGIDQQKLKEAIISSTIKATEKIPLRPNAVDVVTGKNSGNNIGKYFPIIYFEQTAEKNIVIDLMLKGGGSENISMIYKLPDERINASRDLDGVRRCVLDAVCNAQGLGCPPYTIAVGIGATKDQVAVIAKKQLFRRINQRHPVKEIAELEERLLKEINSLGIGPLGFGGKTTVLSVNIEYADRHPATYFVEVSFSCWANRRGKLIICQ